MVGRPRRTRGGPGFGGGSAATVEVLIGRPQSGGDLEEPGLERGVDLLEPVDRDAALDQEPVDLGHHLPVGAGGQAHPEPVRPEVDAASPRVAGQQGAGPVGGGAVDLEFEGRAGQQARRWAPGG